MKKIKKIILVCFVFSIFIAWYAWAAKPNINIPANRSSITEVQLVDPFNLLGSGGEIYISGQDFPSNVNVSLGEYGDLTVTSITDNEIIAELPAGLVPGDYLLSISDSNAASNLQYALTVGAESVPTGMVAFFPSTQCPPGWSEETSARGRTVVGLPLSGTISGTVGTALTDTENRSHDHDLSLAAGNTGTDGDHNHTGIVSIVGAHTHGDDTGVTSDTGNHDCDDAFTCGGVGTSHTHPIASDGGHSHLIQGDTGHSHTIGGTSGTSSGASTSDVMPYLQLLVCKKD
jgi:hypothetical protein